MQNNDLFIPLRCSYVVSAPTLKTLQSSNNLQLLKAFAQLSNEIKDHYESNKDEETRIEGKLDLILLLLGQISLQQSPLPIAENIRLGRSGIWIPAPQPTEGTCQISLFLAPSIPLPITFQGQFGQHEQGTQFIQFAPLTDDEDHWLGQLLFKEHRKQLRDQQSK
ncbi:PilZ domain-containing protein [Leeia sp. TBRC 13508]|uniref:PilZ domain-containing protein n=1 Tax=Leeia speluncae TaxID=2884804 RepID=A0ABS8D208_9NEIS|nr:PilZ domain-containing protein [Leeia speluncae]MCB6182222.1 PilZ domain-containing protein [Leeia speluncae]